MLITTQAIIFKTFKYSDNSIICKIYTEDLGIKSYLLNNIHTKKAKSKMALFQPLTLLDLVVYNKDNKQLQHIKEAACTEPLKSLHSNIYKSSIALFIAEVLLKTIKEEEANPALFAFVKHFIKLLDATEKNYADFHLIFLLQLTNYLGFYPKTESYKSNCYFDMVEGHFTPREPFHSFFIEQMFSDYFYQLLEADYNKPLLKELNGQLRSVLLDRIINYFKMHLEGMGSINSIEVLKLIYQ